MRVSRGLAPAAIFVGAMMVSAPLATAAPVDDGVADVFAGLGLDDPSLLAPITDVCGFKFADNPDCDANPDTLGDPGGEVVSVGFAKLRFDSFREPLECGGQEPAVFCSGAPPAVGTDYVAAWLEFGGDVALAPYAQQIALVSLTPGGDPWEAIDAYPGDTYDGGSRYSVLSSPTVQDPPTMDTQENNGGAIGSVPSDAFAVVSGPVVLVVTPASELAGDGSGTPGEFQLRAASHVHDGSYGAGEDGRSSITAYPKDGLYTLSAGDPVLVLGGEPPAVTEPTEAPSATDAGSGAPQPGAVATDAAADTDDGGGGLGPLALGGGALAVAAGAGALAVSRRRDRFALPPIRSSRSRSRSGVSSLSGSASYLDSGSSSRSYSSSSRARRNGCLPATLPIMLLFLFLPGGPRRLRHRGYRPSLLEVRDGRLGHTSAADPQWRPLDGRHLFVLDTQGRFRLATRPEVPGRTIAPPFHVHLIPGGSAAGAGEITVRDGRLVLVSDRSGHFRPGGAQMLQNLDRLLELGVDLEGVEVEFCRWDRVPRWIHRRQMRFPAAAVLERRSAAARAIEEAQRYWRSPWRRRGAGQQRVRDILDRPFLDLWQGSSDRA